MKDFLIGLCACFAFGICVVSLAAFLTYMGGAIGEIIKHLKRQNNK